MLTYFLLKPTKETSVPNNKRLEQSNLIKYYGKKNIQQICYLITYQLSSDFKFKQISPFSFKRF